MNDPKINIFKNIDTSELSSIGKTESNSSYQSNNLNVDNEFEQTNQHTKQTINFNDNTGNTDNRDENSQDVKDLKGKNRLGKILPGKIALSMADKIIPSLLVLTLYYLNYKLDKKKLQLTKDEINELAPAVQDCLDSIEINFDNPFITLGVMLGIVYGGKIIDAIPDIEKTTKKKSKETLEDKLNAHIEDIEEIKDNPKSLFEKDYTALAEEIKKARNRGINDAKDYLAKMFPEKIKTLGKKYNIDVTEYLNYTWTPVPRKKKKDVDFDLPE